MCMDLVWMELSKESLVHNFRVIRQLGEGAVCSPCIKANAYGHGIEEVAMVLSELKCESVTVSTLEEAQCVRNAGFEGRIILINYVFPERIIEAIRLKVEVMVYNREVLEAYKERLKNAFDKINVHLAVETGMGRYGVNVGEIPDYLQFFSTSEMFKLVGVMSHFAMADNLDDHYVLQQKEVFAKVEDVVCAYFPEVEFHIANSAGTIRQETKKLYRPGLALYGYTPSEAMTNILIQKGLELHPVMTLKSIVTSVKDLPKGHCIGYDCTSRLARNSRVAVIPIGYADGYDRRLSNIGEVLINKHVVPIIGRVCMNLIMVDVTKISHIEIGDEVILIGEKMSAESLAERIGTISYEVLSSLRESIKKIFVDIP